MTDSFRTQISDLVEKHLNDSLTEDEAFELQELLSAKPEARELYLDLMYINAELQLEKVHLLSSNPSLTDASKAVAKPNLVYGTRLVAALSVAAASLLVAAFFMWGNLPFGGSTAEANVIAEIVDSSDAQWGDCTLPTAVGSELGLGWLRIERGLATIRFASGAEVTLEAPAELELQSSLAGRLVSGTAVVEVPESAHGFEIETPNAVAIDHGTAFAVTVDSTSQTSSIEVIDGEVEVRHFGSNDTMRLTERQRVVAYATELGTSSASLDEAKFSEDVTSALTRPRQFRISTADGKGKEVSVSRGRQADVLENRHSELLLIKNPFAGYERFSRMAYFAFDLSSLPSVEIVAAKFMLTVRPTGLGFASHVGDCEFVVYGLNEQAGSDWSVERITWETAPANLEGAAEVDLEKVRELGRFVVRRGVQHGVVSIEGNELTEFVRGDSDQIVTLIVVRQTQELEPGGLVHGFVNSFSDVGNPPTLLIRGASDSAR